MTMTVRFAASTPLQPQQQTPLFGASSSKGSDDEAPKGKRHLRDIAADLGHRAADAARSAYGRAQTRRVARLGAVEESAPPVPLTPEEALKERLVESGVDDMAAALEAAKQQAINMGHAEVTPLHVMSVMFNTIESISQNAGRPDVQAALAAQIEEGTTLWSALVGDYDDANSDSELAHHVRDAAQAIREELEKLPQNAIAGAEPEINAKLFNLLTDKLDELDQGRSSDELLQRQAQEAFQSFLSGSPQLSMTKKKVETDISEAHARLEELKAPYQERLEPLAAKLQKALTEEVLPKAPKLLAVNGRLDELAEQLNGAVGEMQQAVMMGDTKKAQSLMESTEAADEEMGGLMAEADALLEGEYADLYQEHMQSIQNEIDAVNEEMEANPKIQDMEAEHARAHRAEAAFGEECQSIIASAYHGAKEDQAVGYYREVIQAPFSEDIEPEYLDDPLFKKATDIYRGLSKLLGSNLFYTLGDPERYFKRARHNGAGQAEVDTLNQYTMAIKMTASSLSGRGGDDDENSMMPSVSGPGMIKHLRQLTRFAEAYANVNWGKVGTRKVDLEKLEAILKTKEDIPKEVKGDLVNFVKRGNKTGWRGQPLLILAGGQGTDFLRDQVMEVLKQVLDMPVYKPLAQKSSSLTLMGRMFKGERELSIPAEVLSKTGTPESIVYIDSLYRFLTRGGEDQFEQMTSLEGRRNFQEEDLDATLDASPFVYVAATNDAMILNYLGSAYDDRVNDKDMQVIDLNVDIDVFSRERAAANHFLKPIEAEYNVSFADDVVPYLVRHYAVYARHDFIENFLKKVAKEADGQNFTDDPATITAADVPKLLGPELSRHLIHRMQEPEVGRVNILATYGPILGSMDLVGIDVVNEFEYSPKEDKEGQYHVKRLLIGTGGESPMFEDSARSLEGVLARMTSGTLKSDDGREYTRLKTRKNRMIFNVKAPDNTEGPSAGMAMTLAAVSQATGIPVRNDVALTGTISSATGPGEIGGQFLKIQAGYQDGNIKKFMLPRNNYDELVFEHPNFVQKLAAEGVSIVPVDSIDDVLREGLVDYDALFAEFPQNESVTEASTDMDSPTEAPPLQFSGNRQKQYKPLRLMG